MAADSDHGLRSAEIGSGVCAPERDRHETDQTRCLTCGAECPRRKANARGPAPRWCSRSCWEQTRVSVQILVEIYDEIAELAAVEGDPIARVVNGLLRDALAKRAA